MTMGRETLTNYRQQIERLHERIEAAPFPEEDKKLLHDFDGFLIAENLSEGRRAKLLQHALLIRTRWLRRDLRGATADDVWRAVVAIENAPYRPWTKHGFKVAIRKLMKFATYGPDALRRREYPDSVAGIRTHVPKRDQESVQDADVPTHEEMEKLLGTVRDVQYRAFLAVMYETGSRVSEIGTMRVRNVARDQFSFICDLNGKTGPRSVRVVEAAGYLTNWLNAHPYGSQPEAYLWGSWSAGRWRRISYRTIQKMIKRASRDAGLRKRVYPHMFRHCSITHALDSRKFTEAETKAYYGLVKDSKRLATYSHVGVKQANNAALRSVGIAAEDRPAQKQAVTCWQCGQRNVGAQYCFQCGNALSRSEIQRTEERVAEAGEFLDGFLARPEVQRLFQDHVRAGLRAGPGQGAAPEPQLAPRSPSVPRAEPTPERERAPWRS